MNFVDLAIPKEAASYLNAAMEDSEEMFLVRFAMLQRRSKWLKWLRVQGWQESLSIGCSLLRETPHIPA